MLVLSLLLVTVLLLLAFSMTKDTGSNTRYARRQNKFIRNAVQEQEERRSIHSTKVVKVG